MFALGGVAKDVPLSTIYKGIFPFVFTDVIRVLLIFFFSLQTVHWLPMAPSFNGLGRVEET